MATAEADLAAQRDMAKWAFAVFVVASLGLGTSGVTIFLVWRTLRATRRGNRDARRSSERQLRAYVLIERIELATVRDKPEFTAYARNSGQTPAYGLRFSIGVTSPEPGGDAEIDEQKPFVSLDIGAGADQPMSVRWEVFDGKHRDDVLNGRANAWLHGVITYRDVFGKERSSWFKSVIRGEAHPDEAGKFILTLTPTSDGNHST